MSVPDFSASLKVPNFESTTKDNALHNFFVNSLTITWHNFFNYMHRDHDWPGSHVFGIWWTAVRQGPDHRYPWTHSCLPVGTIQGGEFFMVPYWCGVDFALSVYPLVNLTPCLLCLQMNRCGDNIVEIMWMGSSDEHSTLKSHTSNPDLYARFGTSIQLTNCHDPDPGNEVEPRFGAVKSVPLVKLSYSSIT